MTMDARQFRFVFTASDFERSVSFYEQMLGMKRIGGWDRPDGKGALMSAGGNAVVEILGVAEGSVSSAPSLSGSHLAIEIDDVDRLHERLVQAGAGVLGPPTGRPWGHRVFTLRDPDGIVIAFYSVIAASN